jgi:hypothetical protein
MILPSDLGKISKRTVEGVLTTFMVIYWLFGRKRVTYTVEVYGLEE